MEWYVKGVTYTKLLKLTEAIECFDKAIEINPYDGEAWDNKGFCYSSLSSFQQSIECYDESIKINRDDAYAWLNKGNALSYQSKYSDAIECFDKAIEIKPTGYGVISEIYDAKGKALDKLGKNEEARKCFEIAKNRKAQ